MSIPGMLWAFVRGVLAGRARLAAENLALRQQVAILKHATPRPKLRPGDRVFWVWLSRLWVEWRSVLTIVQPETIIRWHRQGFRLYWRWKSGAPPVGRPRVGREIRDLIRRMARENPLWGAPRIPAELHFLDARGRGSERGRGRVRRLLLLTGSVPWGRLPPCPAAPGFVAGTATLTVTLAPPTITGFTPTSGRVGDPVTITGTNFVGVSSERGRSHLKHFSLDGRGPGG
jgi:hypothetical protein